MDEILYVVIEDNACSLPPVNSNPRMKREVIYAVDFYKYPYKDSKCWYILHSCLLPHVMCRWCTVVQTPGFGY